MIDCLSMSVQFIEPWHNQDGRFKHPNIKILKLVPLQMGTVSVIQFSGPMN